jgi:hypothetical protein
MSNDDKRARLWQEIAAEALRERDPNKREELAIELELALDVRGRKLTTQPVTTNRGQQTA